MCRLVQIAVGYVSNLRRQRYIAKPIFSGTFISITLGSSSGSCARDSRIDFNILLALGVVDSNLAAASAHTLNPSL